VWCRAVGSVYLLFHYIKYAWKWFHIYANLLAEVFKNTCQRQSRKVNGYSI